MTTETDTKPVEQTEEKKEEAKDEVKKEEAEVNNAEEKADDKAEKADKEKKDEKKEAKPKKEPAPPKPAVHKLDFEKDVVYLYQFTRTPVLPSLSPYCLKVETWLRLAGLKYEVSGLAFSLRRGSWGVPESRRKAGSRPGARRRCSSRGRGTRLLGLPALCLGSAGLCQAHRPQTTSGEPQLFSFAVK